jgi:signal transduction histidine kinase
MQALSPPPMERPSLQDALAQRAAFWSAATHDLCQPAQALALFVDRLQCLPADPKAQQVHAYLDSSMQDLTRLLNGLLEVARLDAGQVLPAFAPVSVLEETPGGVWVSGLKGSVQIITVGQSFVGDGQKVRVAQAR